MQLFEQLGRAGDKIMPYPEHIFIVCGGLLGIALNAYRFKQLAVTPDLDLLARKLSELKALPVRRIYRAVKRQRLLRGIDVEMHKRLCERYFLCLVKVKQRIVQVKKHISYHRKPPHFSNYYTTRSAFGKYAREFFRNIFRRPVIVHSLFKFGW